MSSSDPSPPDPSVSQSSSPDPVSSGPNRRAVSLGAVCITIIVILVIAPDVLLVIFAGVLFGVFFRGGGGFVARHTGLAPGWGIGIFILLILAGFAGAMTVFASSAVEQFNQMVDQIPAAVADLRDKINDFAWGERLLDSFNPSGLSVGGGSEAAATAVTGTFGALGSFIIMVFIGLYSALDPDCYRKGVLLLLAPSMRGRAEAVLTKSGESSRTGSSRN